MVDPWSRVLLSAAPAQRHDGHAVTHDLTTGVTQLGKEGDWMRSSCSSFEGVSGLGVS